MAQTTLFEAGKMKDCGYGNRVYSKQGVQASVQFVDLKGPGKNLFAYEQPKIQKQPKDETEEINIKEFLGKTVPSFFQPHQENEKVMGRTIVQELAKVKDVQAQQLLENFRKNMIENDKSQIVQQKIVEVTQSQNNPFSPTHIPSQTYEKQFVSYDKKTQSFRNTTSTFRSVPRKHADHLDKKNRGEDFHLAPGVFSPKFTQTQKDLVKRIVFSQNQKERRTRLFEGAPQVTLQGGQNNPRQKTAPHNNCTKSGKDNTVCISSIRRMQEKVRIFNQAIRDQSKEYRRLQKSFEREAEAMGIFDDSTMMMEQNKVDSDESEQEPAPDEQEIRDLINGGNLKEILEQINYYPVTQQKQPCMVTMNQGSAKISIFEQTQGAHEQRFLPFQTISEVNSKYKTQPQPDFQLKTGRNKQNWMQTTTGGPDYSPNKDYVMRSTRVGHHEFFKFPGRKQNKKQLQEPQLFFDPTFKRKLYTLDAKSPIVRPNFEVLGGRRQTDKTSTFATQLPRDNKMYRITDAWNLDKKETISPFDTHIKNKIHMRQPNDNQSLEMVPYEQKNQELVQLEENVSTASESQFDNFTARASIIKSLDKQFRRTAKLNMNIMKQGLEMSLEQKILAGVFTPNLN